MAVKAFSPEIAHRHGHLLVGLSVCEAVTVCYQAC